MRCGRERKLESLAVLAGDVAHDVNNYLTGILGNAGMVLHKLPYGSPCRPLIEEIQEAAHLAAARTSHLLASSDRARAGEEAVEPDGGLAEHGEAADQVRRL